MCKKLAKCYSVKLNLHLDDYGSLFFTAVADLSSLTECPRGQRRSSAEEWDDDVDVRASEVKEPWQQTAAEHPICLLLPMLFHPQL